MERGRGIHIIVVVIAIVSVLGGVTYIMTRPKAHFETDDLEVYRPSETAGENTKIFFTLSNIGDRTGTFDAELRVDGEILQNRSIKLAENENERINFSVKIDEPGEHSVKIGDISEDFKIEPSEFKVSDLNIGSKVVEPGEPLTVNVKVKNSGDLSGDYNVELKVDGSVEEKWTVTIPGGKNRTVSFDLRKEENGEYPVSIGELSENFEVLAPPEFKVSDLSVSPSLVSPGETVTVTANIKNVGDLPGDHVVKLRVDGEVKDNESVHLEGHQSTSLEFELSRGVERTYSVRVEGAVNSFRVYVQSGGCQVCG